VHTFTTFFVICYYVSAPHTILLRWFTFLLLLWILLYVITFATFSISTLFPHLSGCICHTYGTTLFHAAAPRFSRLPRSRAYHFHSFSAFTHTVTFTRCTRRSAAFADGTPYPTVYTHAYLVPSILWLPDVPTARSPRYASLLRVGCQLGRATCGITGFLLPIPHTYLPSCVRAWLRSPAVCRTPFTRRPDCLCTFCLMILVALNLHFHLFTSLPLCISAPLQFYFVSHLLGFSFSAAFLTSSLIIHVLPRLPHLLHTHTVHTFLGLHLLRATPRYLYILFLVLLCCIC